MEFLNKVELKGIVGSVHALTFGLHSVTRFSLATEYCYKEDDGTPVIETTWFNCAAQGLETKLEKGDKAHVIGRLKARNWTDSHNEPHYTFEVIAQSVSKIED